MTAKRLSAFPPVGGGVRNDVCGSGYFGAPRTGRHHKGVDLEVNPGELVVAPADGTVLRLGKCYTNKPHFDLVEIECGPAVHRILYVEPSVKAGDELEAGDPIGVAQDVRDRHGANMVPHVHWEVMLTDVLLDTGERNHHRVWFNPRLLCILIVFAAAILAAVGVSGACELVLPPGEHLVRLVSYYAHQSPTDPPHLWESEDSEVLTGPWSGEPHSPGHPIGHQWWVGGELVKTCGSLLSFADGFENGTTSRWSTTIGG